MNESNNSATSCFNFHVFAIKVDKTRLHGLSEAYVAESLSILQTQDQEISADLENFDEAYARYKNMLIMLGQDAHS
jgi:hypothetical protein